MEIDRFEIAYILEIIQAYLTTSDPNGLEIAKNGPLIEEIYSRVNDARREKAI